MDYSGFDVCRRFLMLTSKASFLLFVSLWLAIFFASDFFAFCRFYLAFTLNHATLCCSTLLEDETTISQKLKSQVETTEGKSSPDRKGETLNVKSRYLVVRLPTPKWSSTHQH